jgi:hypothetical protein
LSIDKKLNFGIIFDDDSLKGLGLEKVTILNKNILITLSDGQTILSKFKIDDLEATLRGIKKKLVDKGIKGHTIEHLELFLTDKILQMLNESDSDSASGTNLRKIEEEIEKDRISIGEISEQQWQDGVLEKYQKLKNEVEAKLPSLWPGLEFILSNKTILNIKDCTLIILPSIPF